MFAYGDVTVGTTVILLGTDPPMDTVEAVAT